MQGLCLCGHCSTKPVKVQREATVLLVELVLYLKPNCKLLAGLPAAPALFADCMSRCGDYVMQLDLAEVLFRYCCRRESCTTGPPVLQSAHYLHAAHTSTLKQHSPLAFLMF
jgi:hypothetical protein